ncbi:Oidioi.mRNA.OKI2018_I69.chr1.g2187.t2.cds [Oikopleura dioica]|uniref:Oidioi.mRNA.OKI2018_I69.chr1.g2187.t2.cds n=1 Tax=Oikopleura dioica TaxID=34765 RepID=A0ABN7SQC6_OIKDI|nr:Oidioi.mRNA.OKI2018_I69.chr1.g2187.t2.cds [Oikopleura dioica]
MEFIRQNPLALEFKGHPHYLNQLSSGVDIVTLAADWIIATCNTNMFTYEIAPVFVLPRVHIMFDCGSAYGNSREYRNLNIRFVET